MNSKSKNNRRRNISAALIAVLAVALTVSTFSSSAQQKDLNQGQPKPTGVVRGQTLTSAIFLPTIVITGEDIRNLPAGENRIVQESEGESATGASGGVWKTTNGGKSWSLIKTGPGRIALPPANGAATKSGQGILVLTDINAVVYEFRNLGPLEFDSVLVPRGESFSINYTKIINACKRIVPKAR